MCSLLKGIPRNFPAPILAVIHLSEDTQELLTILQRCRALKVVDATKVRADSRREGVYRPAESTACDKLYTVIRGFDIKMPAAVQAPAGRE